MIDRRRFLAVSAAGVAAGLAGACASRAPVEPSGTAGVLEVPMRAAETEVDLGGVPVRTWTYTGTVPATEIRLRKGQTLRAPVTNTLPQETTVHWHGLAIPNAMDGVPVLTGPAIAPGGEFTYEFRVPDAGTYYLHSHVGTQLDRGMYGPLIIEDPADGADYDDELVVVLDDWIDGTGTDPDQVFAQLRRTGMDPMDPGGPGVSPVTPLGTDGGDVTYPYYLINGRVSTDPQVVDYRAGQRIRLRIINAGADTAFRVGVPGHALRVTHTDGFPVVPRQTDSVILGMGERADAVVEVTGSAPVVAAAYGKDGYARLDMRVGGVRSTVDVDAFVSALRSQAPLNTATLAPDPAVALPARPVDATVDLALQGPVAPYAWPINGKLYDPPDNGIGLRAGTRVRMRYVNESSMYHPMHLHGQTFQVLGGPRKDTVLVPPKQTVEVDFDTDNPGRWIVHCHNDYHLNAGMATFIEY
ncbi:MAG: multicopper oxidase family protein [Actinomycetota bacterium]|nr:multicopper oxidase family protein [Actinomycetota bacterium]